ncbi:MAG TPA: restriction endonuclease subunit S, partial [Clostridium sp.]|nr:restriction endonuclease subunit S [Clostridium sp.]
TDFGLRFPDITTYTTTPKKVCKNGDILLSVRAPVGDLNIAVEDCSIGRGLAALRSKIKCNSYLFYLLKTFKAQFDISNGEGTVFGSITKGDLHGLCIIYSQNEVEKFERLIFIIDEKIKNYCFQNRLLIDITKGLSAKMIHERG